MLHKTFARDFPDDSAEFRLSRRLAYLLAPQWLSSEVEAHLSWLLTREVQIANESLKWTVIRDLVTSVYAWWAEGVHLRHQRSGAKNTSPWKAPFVDELFAQAMPFDDPKREAIPLRTTSLDAHLGHALMRISCLLHQEMSKANSTTSSRRADYQVTENGITRLRPGGGFLHAIRGRLTAEGWRGFSLGGLLTGKIDLTGERLDPSLGSHARLEGSKLTDADLRASYLYAINLSRCDLRRTKFDYADMRMAVLQRSSMKEASFFLADMRLADLTSCDLTSAYLLEADLTGANLTGSNLAGVKFGHARLNQANLTDANLEDADFKGADLTGANLSGAKLKRTNFKGANMTHVIVTEEMLTRGRWRGAMGLGPKSKRKK